MVFREGGASVPPSLFLLTEKRVEAGLLLPFYGDMPRSSSSERDTVHSGRAVGFTLIELLAMLAVVGILAAMVLGGGRRANEVGKVARAKAEVDALALGLEAYRRRHGDFPRVENPAEWVQVLVSAAGVTAAVDWGRFAIEPAGGETGARVLDPWGNPYFYFYKTGGVAGWRSSGFVLYSAGPNGVHVPPNAETGFFDPLHLDNADNIYAGL